MRFLFVLMIGFLPVAVFSKDPFILPKKPHLMSASISFYYNDINQMESYIKNTLISKSGRVLQDKKNNRLLIYDYPQNIDKIKKLKHRLDTPSSQILIQAKIVIIDTSSMRELGALISAHASNNAGFVFPLIQFNHQRILDLTLNALEKKGRAIIISEPELVTSNHKTATIASGEELPYQERTGHGNTSIAFKKAVLQLEVTPLLLPNQKIRLKLNIHQDKPSQLMVNGIPAISTQQLKTDAIVSNQQTLVLGGIQEQMKTKQTDGIPLLNHLPLIGWLFHQNKKQTHQQRLLIFITPRIINCDT